MSAFDIGTCTGAVFVVVKAIEGGGLLINTVKTPHWIRLEATGKHYLTFFNRLDLGKVRDGGGILLVHPVHAEAVKGTVAIIDEIDLV